MTFPYIIIKMIFLFLQVIVIVILIIIMVSYHNRMLNFHNFSPRLSLPILWGILAFCICYFVVGILFLIIVFQGEQYLAEIKCFRKYVKGK